MGETLIYILAAAFGWSVGKAWFGFWAWRDRRFWRRLYARAYGWPSDGL